MGRSTGSGSMTLAASPDDQGFVGDAIFEGLWAGGDLNPQALRHKILSLACLPISPLAQPIYYQILMPELRCYCLMCLRQFAPLFWQN